MRLEPITVRMLLPTDDWYAVAARRLPDDWSGMLSDTRLSEWSRMYGDEWECWIAGDLSLHRFRPGGTLIPRAACERWRVDGRRRGAYATPTPQVRRHYRERGNY